MTAARRVRNGARRTPAIELDKFIILVTAEPSANVSAPSGLFVLRGASPSTRLQPADLMQFTLGATREPDSHTMQHQHAAPNTRSDSARWTTVPMPPNLQMLPAEMMLRPSVAPYLPSAKAAAPRARPRELVRLGNGDTLRLRAGLVRRSFKSDMTMSPSRPVSGPLLQSAARDHRRADQRADQRPPCMARRAPRSASMAHPT